MRPWTSRSSSAPAMPRPFPNTSPRAHRARIFARAWTATWCLRPGRARWFRRDCDCRFPAGSRPRCRPRSGLAARHGITVLNAPGTIDSDYRGEVQVILVNLGQEEFRIRSGDRIAQLVFSPVVRVSFQAQPLIDETARGSGGFGSTGI